MKVLNIIETGYRATVEEQDDPVVWIVHAMLNCGADMSIFLRGNAVNYLVAAQHSPPVVVGARRQKQAPQLCQSIEALIARKIAVYADVDDIRERGIREDEMIAGATVVRASDLPQLMEKYDRIWHW
jgi:sulfur relay (sulfurtransferase) DsrF/TusC family protein